MKHAMIITAYKDYALLEEIVSDYVSIYHCDCYVHIDAKSKGRKDIVSRLNVMPGVTCISEYRVNWGSIRHVKAYLRLLEIAIAKGYDYYHLLSANTYIGVSYPEFDAFFSANTGHSFLENVCVHGAENEEDLVNWYRYYYYRHLYNLRGKFSGFWNQAEYYGLKIQKKLGVRRNVTFDYKGYVYCHLTEEAVSYVFEYLKNHKRYIKDAQYCAVGEEFFFHHLLMNSHLKDSVINNCLIYDNWEDSARGIPAVLDMSDLQMFEASGLLFVRKIEDTVASRALYMHLRNKNS